MLPQKSYVGDNLNKKKCKNNGGLPRYYVNSSHEAIIDRSTFDKVQQEIKRRSKKPTKLKNQHLFTGKIISQNCGSFYKYKINNSSTKYAKPVWVCSTFNSKGKDFFPSKQIPEDILKEITAERLDIPKFDLKIFTHLTQKAKSLSQL